MNTFQSWWRFYETSANERGTCETTLRSVDNLLITIVKPRSYCFVQLSVITLYSSFVATYLNKNTTCLN